MYLPPLLEALGLAEVTHEARNNRMRALWADPFGLVAAELNELYPQTAAGTAAAGRVGAAASLAVVSPTNRGPSELIGAPDDEGIRQHHQQLPGCERRSPEHPVQDRQVDEAWPQGGLRRQSRRATTDS